MAAPAVNVATVRNLLLKASGIGSIHAAEDGTNAIANFTGDNPGQAGSLHGRLDPALVPGGCHLHQLGADVPGTGAEFHRASAVHQARACGADRARRCRARHAADDAEHGATAVPFVRT